jgi:hypothetical protein
VRLKLFGGDLVDALTQLRPPHLSKHKFNVSASTSQLINSDTGQSIWQCAKYVMTRSQSTNVLIARSDSSLCNLLFPPGRLTICSCSIPCFKSHINTHDQSPPRSPKPSSESKQEPSSSPDPSDHRPIAKLKRDPRFTQLLTKYPNLRDVLRRVYYTTQHPSTLPEDAQLELEQQQKRSQKGGRRGRHDVWTQEKADERALGLLIELDLRDEGVAEFLELSREALLGRAENVKMEDG